MMMQGMPLKPSGKQPGPSEGDKEGTAQCRRPDWEEGAGGIGDQNQEHEGGQLWRGAGKRLRPDLAA